MGRTIGILGGMGPRATVDLFEKIVRKTSAAIDQEHPRIIIDNNPQIPSRIQAILEGAEDPLPHMIKSAQLLEAAGADFIIIPCHTAHFWLDKLQTSVNIPIYSMVENTVSYIEKHQRHLSGKILLFTTTASLEKKLYQDTFRERGLNICIPEADEQKIVLAAILEAKASRIEDNPFINALNQVLKKYLSRGITAVLCACTELPLLFPYLEEGVEKLDPTWMLAEKAVTLASEVGKI